jgi:hypothetical protein
MPKRSRDVYQLKVALLNVKPPIWRRLLITRDTNLARLHEIIQIAMGWMDTHLHQFVAGRAHYAPPNPDYDDGSTPEAGVAIRSLLKKEKQWILYEYDFGDGWSHRITLEKTLERDDDKPLPRCTGGRRACPPEDVGGPYGYIEFLKAYSNESHPDHEEKVDWAGDYFQPEEFDADEVNKLLASI